MIAQTLKRSTRTEIPSGIFVVHTSTVYTSDDRKQNAIRGTLRSFHSLYFRLEDDRATRLSECIDCDSELFWSHLSSKSHKGSTLWIFGLDLCRHLTKLGFWKKLEEKHFTLEPRYSKSTGKDGKPKSTWTGKLCLEERPFFIVCRRGDTTYRFVDVCNYWPNGISSLTSASGTVAMKEPDSFSPEIEFAAYNANRVEIVSEAMKSLITQWRHEQCGTFGYTSAMLAMSSFRHRCPIRNATNDKLDIVFHPGHFSHELEREAYFGGRTQAFYVGEYVGKVYHIDCNSLYPYVMRNNNFPRRFVRHVENESVESLRLSSKVYGTIARVLIDSPDMEFPLRIDDLQYHVTGRFWATLADAELKRALTANVVKAVSVAQYYSVAPLFEHWIDYWHGRKIAAESSNPPNLGERELCKMVLNSLYGKFAQRTKQWRDIPGTIPLVKWGGWPEYCTQSKQWRKCRGVGGNSQVLIEKKEPRHSFPAISAFVTSLGREYMRKCFSLAGVRNVLYSATDSMIVTRDGYDRLLATGFIHPTKLGKFKVKGEHEYAKINGSNNYQLDNTVTCAGLLGASLAQGGDGTEAEIAESIASLIQRERPDCISLERVKVPAQRQDFRGRITRDCWWLPYSVQDPLILTGQLAVLTDRREYSLGMAASRTILLFDV